MDIWTLRDCAGTDTAATDCDDDNACTDDTCDPATGCLNSDNTFNCDDGNACTDDSCDPATGCVNTNNALACDDGDTCTTSDICSDGACAGTDTSATDCDDDNACTDDSCVDGNCVNEEIKCDDDDACTSDSCMDGNCVNEEIDCDDGNACTADSCDPATGCVNTNNALDCDETGGQVDPPIDPNRNLCGSGLCGFGASSMMPFMLIVLSVLKMRRHAYVQEHRC